MKLSTITALAALSIAGPSSALGINCRGSSSCAAGFMDHLRNYITDNLNGVDPNYQYSNGEKVACRGYHCCFPQDMGNRKLSGQRVRDLIVALGNHGCSGCGSVPYDWPGGPNDVSRGQLTCNYVTATCGNGVCNGALNPRK